MNKWNFFCYKVQIGPNSKKTLFDQSYKVTNNRDYNKFDFKRPQIDH